MAPTGRTNREINLLILFFSSMHVKVVGRAAVDEAVATAINKASNIFFVNFNIFFLVTNMYNPGNTIKAFFD